MRKLFNQSFIRFLLLLVICCTFLHFSQDTSITAEAKEYHLMSNPAQHNGLAVEELGHSSSTPFRFFTMETDDGEKRVFCGYALGRGHPKDAYTKTVFKVGTWTSRTDKPYGKNVKKIARALIYFHENKEKGEDADNTLLRKIVQTYVWAQSMGKDAEVALKQLADSLKIDYATVVKPIYNKIDKFDLTNFTEGKIEVYDKNSKACVENVNLEHQPYYRYIPPDDIIYKEPKFDYINEEAEEKTYKKVFINIAKYDSFTKNMVGGTKFTIRFTDASGNITEQIVETSSDPTKPDIYGRYMIDLDRPIVGYGKSELKKYVVSWGDMTPEQKAKEIANGCYSDYSAAYQAALTEAQTRAKADLEAKKAAQGPVKWEVVEISSPGHIVRLDQATQTDTEYATTTGLAFSFYNQPQKLELTVKKVATTDKYDAKYSPVGAKYELRAAETLYNSKGFALPKDTLLKSITMPESLSVTIPNLPAGKMYLIETESPPGFKKDDTVHMIEITGNAEESEKLVIQKEVVVKEEPKNGRFQFTKLKGTKTNNAAESGITFELKGAHVLKDGTHYSVKKTTDSNGYVEWTNIPFGIYTLTQTTIKNDSYAIGPYTVIIDEEHQNVTLPAGDCIDYNKDPGRVQIKKMTVSPETGNADDIAADGTFPVIRKDESGAVFEIQKNGTKVEELTTDGNGYAISKKLAPGTYTLTQTKGASGFNFVEDKTFVVKEGSTESFYYYLENPDNRHYLSIKKIKTPREIDRTYTGRGNNLVDGSPLPEAGAVFYILDMAKLSASAKDTLNGMDTLNEARRQNFVKSLEDAIIGDAYKTDEMGVCEKYFPAGYELSEEGFCVLQVDGDDDYHLMPPIYSTGTEITMVKKGETTAYSFKGNNPGKVYYTFARITKKMDANESGDSRREKDAEFELCRNDGSVFGTYRTDNRGEFWIPYLVQGDYYLKQTKGSPYHEFVNVEESDLYIVSQDCTMEESRMEGFVHSGFDLNYLSKKEKESIKEKYYTINNKAKPAKILLEKYSTRTLAPLNGAVYSVRKKRVQEDGSVKWDEVTRVTTGAVPEGSSDAEKQKMLGKIDCVLDYGDYMIREIDAPYGYLLTEEDNGIESTDPNFKYQDVYFTIDADHVTLDESGEVVYTVEPETNKATPFVFKDHPIMGKVKVNKYGSVATELLSVAAGFMKKTDNLAGATFGLYANEDIYDDAGTLIHAKDSLISTAVSSDEDYVYFTRQDNYDPSKTTDEFFLGDYYIMEIAAPEGYVRDENKHYFTLSCDGTGAKVSDMMAGTLLEEEEEDFATSHGNYFLTTGKKLNPIIKSAERVIFTHISAPVGKEKQDVSADTDGTVVLWWDGQTAFISSQKNDQVIYFNLDSSDMFYDCISLKEIVFNNIDTQYMVFAENMFRNMSNESMKSLDLSNFSTNSLNNTVSMFQGSNYLQTIYVGSEKPEPLQTVEPTVTGIVAYPVYSRYFYFNPNGQNVSEKAKKHNKLKAEHFDFYQAYSNGLLIPIDVEDTDLKSISPNYPYMKDAKKGDLPVDIVIDKSSKFALNNSDTNVRVTINVVDPADYDFEPFTVEHPEISMEIGNEEKKIDIVIRKVSSKDKNITLEAKYEVTAVTDLVDKDGKLMVKNGDVVARLTSMTKIKDDGGDASVTGLPTGLYAKDKNAKYLYKIREVEAPAGYLITQSTHVAYIPNIDLTKPPEKGELEGLVSNFDDIDASFKVDESGKYGTYEFTVTFENPPCPTITKKWLKKDKLNMPKQLEILAYAKNNPGVVAKRFYLTPENNWTVPWLDLPTGKSVTDYTYSEVIPQGSKWQQVGNVEITESTDPYHPSTVTFVNEFTNDPKTSRTVCKVWDDNNNYDKIRPSQVIVTLLQNGKPFPQYEKVTLDQSNSWKYTTAKVLPIYDSRGAEYHYEWVEDRSAGSQNLKFLTDNPRTGYVESSSQTTDTVTTITNKHEVYTHCPVQKTWNDRDDYFGVRPDSIKVSLYANGEIVKEFDVTFTRKIDGKITTSRQHVKNGKVTLNDKSSWKADAVDLKKFDDNGNEIKYEWKEVSEVPYYETRTVTNIAGNSPDGIYYSTKIINDTTVRFGGIVVEKKMDKKVYDYLVAHSAGKPNSYFPNFMFALEGKTMKGDYYQMKSLSFADKSRVEFTNDGFAVVKAAFGNLDMGIYHLSEKKYNKVYLLDNVDGIRNGVKERDENGNVSVRFDINVDNFSEEMSASFTNIPNQGKLNIVKLDKDGKTPLEGVTFKLESLDDQAWTAMELTTGKNGEVVFDEIPCGNYTITEIKTVKGHNLLTQPIDVTLPMAVTEEEAAAKNIDLTNAIYSVENDTYNIYNLTYTVTNHGSMRMPMTGEKKDVLSALFWLTGILSVNVLVFTGFKRKRKH